MFSGSFYNTLIFFNNVSPVLLSYHYFFISVVIFSELLIFITLFVIFLYFNSAPDVHLFDVLSFNTFSYSFFYSSFEGLLLIALLSIILISINTSIYLFNSIFLYSTSSLVLKDLLLSIVLLSFLFAFIQYYEFIYQGVTFQDSVFFNVLYSLIVLHFFHVFLGGALIFLLFLFI